MKPDDVGLEVRPAGAVVVKLRRARVHIDEVHQRVRALDASKPWSVEKEASEDPDSWTFRFRIYRPIPADLRATAGDAIANMRSALDYAAYELAVRHVGTLTPCQENATAFPICKDRETFDRFFTSGRFSSVRAEIYGETERLALRCVQPFALGEEARSLGVEWSAPADHELLTDGAWALNAVWNISTVGCQSLPGAVMGSSTGRALASCLSRSGGCSSHQAVSWKTMR